MMDPYSDEYYEGPLGLRNPKSAQHTHAAYLLGMESMPPIYPRDQPLAYLNSSAFAPAGNSAYDCELHSHYYYYSIANCMTKIYVAPDTMTQDSTDSDRLDVRVPVPAKEKDGQPTMATIHFPFDIPPFCTSLLWWASILRQLNWDRGHAMTVNEHHRDSWQKKMSYVSFKRWLAWGLPWGSVAMSSKFIWKLSAWWGTSVSVSEHSLWQLDRRSLRLQQPPSHLLSLVCYSDCFVCLTNDTACLLMFH